MKLSTRSKEYIIPEYSLTGDLLSFLTCNLQYRYQNKGNLPPSMPIQLWFGEFIHGVMEEAFLKWNNLSEDRKNEFPWDWEKEIMPIEETITERLKVKGLNPPNDYESNYGPKENMYSARVEKSINSWGPHLFPLIEDAEVLIKGIRDMPSDSENARSEYYSINGVIDVLSSVKLDEISSIINQVETMGNSSSNEKTESNKSNSFQQTLDNFFVLSSNDESQRNDNANKILEYLANDEEFKEILKNFEGDEYEIIIDYKGMRRPSAPKDNDESSIHLFNDDSNEEESDYYRTWMQHEWQILTYAWLRSKQEDAKPVLCGIIFYLNELVPSTDDLISIREDLREAKTDIPVDKISRTDWELLDNWNEYNDLPIHRDLSNDFKMNRSIRIINIKEDLIEESLSEFDNVVNEIEGSMIKELNGSSIKDAWKADAEERTCTACDFRTFCNKKDKNDGNGENAPVFTIP